MKVMLSLIAIFFATTSFSQIQIKQSSPKTVVGTLKAGGVLQQELSYKLDEDNDTIYTLMYKNAEYRSLIDYESVSFNSEGNTLNELYKVLKSVFSPENVKNKEYEVKFTLGETNVTVSNFRQMGFTTAMFFTKDGYTFMGDKQLDKLFGK